jgi:hypothetical protein
MKKLMIGLTLACATSTSYAVSKPDELKLRFMNCTGKAIVTDWSGYKTNVDKNPTPGVQSGKFTLPAGKLIVNKTLRIYRTDFTVQDEHSFNLVFSQGITASTKLIFSTFKGNFDYYSNIININSTNNVYAPNTRLIVDGISPAPVADIQIGCEDS